MFSGLEVEFGSLGISDHGSILVRLREELNFGPKFHLFFIKHPRNYNIRAQTWYKFRVGNLIKKFGLKLKVLKVGPRKLINSITTLE